MRILLLFIFILFGTSCAQKPTDTKLQWTFTRQIAQKPRGGTTIGPKVEYDQTTSPNWKRLQSTNSSKWQRDRQSILALTGVFEARFEFLESFSLSPQKELDPPYRSWGTEWVFAIEESESAIRLQHVMAMYFVDPKTKDVIGPMVMKHWRQDWTWNPDTRFVYTGKKHWKKQNLSKSEAQGKWLWSVYQVDDSPRYEALGTWTHDTTVSTFSTERIFRPLPRRERTLRQDYDILMGEDQLILTPSSWYHEQRNWKFQGEIGANFEEEGRFLSRELGHNSYRRLKNFDYQAAKDYWQKTASYWQAVREAWQDIKNEKDSFRLKSKIGDQYLFAVHFQQAEDQKVLAMTAEQKKNLARETITKFLH